VEVQGGIGGGVKGTALPLRVQVNLRQAALCQYKRGECSPSHSERRVAWNRRPHIAGGSVVDGCMRKEQGHSLYHPVVAWRTPNAHYPVLVGGHRPLIVPAGGGQGGCTSSACTTKRSNPCRRSADTLILVATSLILRLCDTNYCFHTQSFLLSSTSCI
jgi:hypothetical protein